MKNLAALAFIPPQNVIEEFVRIKENASEVLDGKYIFAQVLKDLTENTYFRKFPRICRPL